MMALARNNPVHGTQPTRSSRSTERRAERTLSITRQNAANTQQATPVRASSTASLAKVRSLKNPMLSPM